ncbi:copper resistance protein B [Sphingosinicella sp. BN140058]|uniref:copper resistance protein B n=1 Tax=Sphingosinicella sp. BN140058 TaxID=1892855 RepID=UPI001012AD30|nr:copper resistance protein B [Sphingosinicella sp. BN140058]QAY77558.1 copper resistance protein B [Sphingosinicella sp. BN140058]
MRAGLILLAACTASPALAQHEGHDPHAGHAMPAARDPSCPPEHAAMGHCTPATAATAIEVSPGAPPQGAMSGPEHAADQVWGTEGMAPSRATLRGEHGGMAVGKILIDRAEYRSGGGYAWEVQAWHGGDADKLWLKSEGEGDGRLDRGEVQALWSHAIGPWFDLQAGLRQDFGRGPDRTHAVLTVQGLAPYWFEIEAAAFVSNKGELSARAEADYDLRLTQRLILQPRIEADVQAQDVPRLRLGSGLSRGEIGLRLRYQFVPEFAPYVGVAYERAFGDTARLRRAAGEARGGWSMLLGVRAWF